VIEITLYESLGKPNSDFHYLLWANLGDQIVVENGQVCPWQLLDFK
jgi:hypothetical protein